MVWGMMENECCASLLTAQIFNIPHSWGPVFQLDLDPQQHPQKIVTRHKEHL